MILILGPCVIESEDHAVRMAQSIKRIVYSLGLDFTFKASFDKANRTSLHGYRGPGLQQGIDILEVVKDETGCRVISDIHEPWQAEKAAAVLDIIQIPALLSRQTDLLLAAADTGLPINLKKGQFMAPEDVFYAVEKLLSRGPRTIYLTERGTSFGYHNLVVDMRSIATMRLSGLPVIIDATHAVQKPSAGGGKSAGEPEFIPVIARAAVAAGAEGVFLEVHDDPAHALSDGPNSLRLDALRPLLRQLVRVKEAVACTEP